MIHELGRHRVQCQDVMLGVDNLMRDEKADFIYSDPPWGQGNLKYWQTINKRHTGKEPSEIDYEMFLPLLFGIFQKYAKDCVVIEYGEKWRDDIIAFAKQYGFVHGGVCTSLYGSPSKLLPLDVHVFSKSGKYHVDEEFKQGCLDLRGGDLSVFVFGKMMTAEALASKDTIILDPMCGMGYTARAAIKYGFRFRGNELNAKRLNVTIKRLQKDSVR